MNKNREPGAESTGAGGRESAAPAATAADSSNIIIIGGGVAGLACGCYLQMNGFQTEILEAGTTLGGLCAAWDRGPYIFDGCLRWLVGANPSSAFHRVWAELGVVAEREFISPDEVVRIEGRGGEVLSLPADLDRVERELTRIAPEDAALIRRLVRAARRSAPLEPIEQPLELMTPFEKMRTALRYLPMVPVVAKWKNLPVTNYLAGYRNPFLREALKSLAGDERVSALVLVMLLAFRSGNNTAFVRGGSRAFVQTLANRFARLGGRVRHGARVVSVTVANGAATGVRCADGAVVPAPAVVSCADGYTTIFKMLEGRYVQKSILYAYQTCDPFPSLIQVSLGINRTFPEAPHALILLLSHPVIVDDKTQHHRLEVTVFGANSALCPEGHTVMTVRLTSRWDYWTRLKDADPGHYQAEKARILQEIIGLLDKRFPGLAQNLEATDVATPATFFRYTGNWQGSYEGWLPTPRILGRWLPFVLPGLKEFYMAGHWVVPGGGLPSAVLSGRYVAQLICARNGRTFAASAP